MRCLRFWLFLLVTGLTPGANAAWAADSLNMRTVGRWPFGGQSVAVGDETRQLVFCGSSGGVYVLDAANPESLRVVSERIQTRGIVSDLFYDDANQRLYVACVEGGLEIWDVATPASPYRLGYLARADHASAVAVSGDYAFVADRDSGLRVVSVADPANPYQAARLDTPGDARDVAVLGSYAYIADSNSVRVVDISTPANPREVGHCDSTRARAIVASGQYAYIAGSGLQVVSVADPAHPYKMGFCPTPSSAVDVALAGSYAYVSDWSFGLIVVDVSNPQSPTRVNSLLSLGRATVRVSGTHAYAVAFELAVLDITDPRNPSVLGSFVAPNSVYGGIAVSGNYAYETDDYKGIVVIDVSDPTATREVARCDTGGGTMSLLVQGQWLFAGYQAGDIRVVSISDPLNPLVVGTTDVHLPPDRLALTGSLLCVSGQMDVPIVDVSDPTSPCLAAVYEDPWIPNSVAAADSLLYVADASELGSGGLRIASLSDPSNPRELSITETPGRAYDVAVQGNYAYVADGDSGLAVIDVADPTAPHEASALRSLGHATSIFVCGAYAYVGCYPGGMRMIDIADPTHPREVGFHTGIGTAGNIAAQGSLVFTVDRRTNINIAENTLYGISEASPRNAEGSIVRLLANPISTGLLKVVVAGEAMGAIGLSVFDVSGGCVLKRRVLERSRCSAFAVPVGTLPVGAYVARISWSGGDQSVKFAIARGTRHEAECAGTK